MLLQLAHLLIYDGSLSSQLHVLLLFSRQLHGAYLQFLVLLLELRGTRLQSCFEVLHTLLSDHPVVFGTEGGHIGAVVVVLGLYFSLQVLVDVAKYIHALILALEIVSELFIMLLHLFHFLLSLVCLGLLLPYFVFKSPKCLLLLCEFTSLLILDLLQSLRVCLCLVNFGFLECSDFFLQD